MAVLLLTWSSGLQGNHENRIYELKMNCGENYPKEPPTIYFVSQINLPGVNNVDGLVDKNSIGILRDWTAIATQLSKNPRPREDPLSLEAALISIRKYVFLSGLWIQPWSHRLTCPHSDTWRRTRSFLSPPRAPAMPCTRTLSRWPRGHQRTQPGEIGGHPKDDGYWMGQHSGCGHFGRRLRCLFRLFVLLP